ncbi:hypothetical protein KM043_007994 [Ampulex compressa]|nr:hypothetical protein KM043_007994 [Ampulex compressa]
MIFASKYSIFSASIPNIVKVMNFIKQDWAILMYEGELRILENYMRAKIIMLKCLAVIIGQCVICFNFFSLLPCIFMLINPSNTPRRQKIPVLSLWLEGSYYNVVAIYLCFVASVGGMTLIGTEGLMVMFVQHACAMFSIACMDTICDNRTIEGTVSQKCRLPL